MPYLSRVQYPGTGTTALYSIPFAYISKAYIEVRVGGVLLTEGVGYSWQSATTILLLAGNLPTGVTLDIRRSTPKVEKLVDFQDGSVLTEADLDLSANQVFQLVQETVDEMDFQLGLDATGVFDAGSHRIANLADPVDAQDAVTKGWANAASESALAGALDASATAVAAADSAAASAVQAASYSSGVTGGDNTWTGTNTFNESPVVPTVTPGDSSTKAASTGFVAAVVTALTALINAVLPAQATNGGKYLKTDGTAASWQTVPTPSGSILASGYTQNTAKLLGRTTASVGAPEEISVGSGLTMSAGNLTNSGVLSINGVSGAMNAASLAAIATAGYGYTPANGASYVPKDLGAGNFPIGSIAAGSKNNGTAVAVGGTAAGSTIENHVHIGTFGSGTWRNIDTVISYDDSAGGGNRHDVWWQRIA